MSNKVIEFKGEGVYTDEKGKEKDVLLTFKSNGEVKRENGEMWIRIIPENNSLNMINLNFN